ncbi:hypothetical protein E3J74_04805 [Candidatus Bathyarchaeota archaeon]|nr:MAG: hypothetical protein E3J74_04805 [Candidatus Bathyarchaeota archaeon]
MVNDEELRKAKRAIMTWLSFGTYPKEYLLFFFYWSLFNSYYGLGLFKGGDKNKVLSFGRQYNALWNKVIKANARDLVAQECVGNGKGENPPSSQVKAATGHLRNLLGVHKRQICIHCRPDKRNQCSRVAEKGKDGHLEALLRIIYQIRCNLIHGDKVELKEDQGERNKKLVRLATPILREILLNL